MACITSILIFIISYTAGSINFPILLFRILGKGDPRDKFSGNPGVTNVYRQAGPAWAAAILVLDMGRAVGVAVVALHLLKISYVPWAGLCLVIGNRFPCFHRFQGGKGVANFLGFTMAISPLAGILSGPAWLAVSRITRHPFIGSFCMVFILAAGTVIELEYDPLAIVGTLATAFLIFFSHKKNVKELIEKRN